MPKSSRGKSGINSRSITYLVVVVTVAGLYYLREKGGFGNSPSVSAGSLPKITNSSYELLAGCRLVGNRGNDGDSFRVRHQGEEYTFRLYFVDCPESSDRYPDRIEHQARYFDNITPKESIQVGHAAKKFTLDLLDEKPFAVLTRWENVMKSYRYHAFVLVETEAGNTEYLSEILVRNGLARIYTLPADLPDGRPKKEFERRLKDLEKNARSANVGAWRF